jgi:acyl carrier protein
MGKTIQETIRNFIIENFLFGEPTEFSDGESLLEKGIIDSTGVLELVAYIEQTYGIKVEDEELVPENLDSISNVVEYISRKQAKS